MQADRVKLILSGMEVEKNKCKLDVKLFLLKKHMMLPKRWRMYVIYKDWF